ncbi:hypothetical protein GGR20_000947 [Devosia subaequoris]|uniref:Flagellar FlbD family protein n=1 Tax=Devosia subaequoris TaxID=395930 RepID=A0A7W6NB45_9HYPH|nr:hypothetical protein [Devosia subaequoris]MBB4051311.1 hypothetical protein [Devosia subaequoris]MCP1208911.1 hypothetical protein [Devosia subaequoris]
MQIIKLTSAVASARPTVYVNVDHIISFSDQAGGCQLRVTGGNNVVAVKETAETVARLIEHAARSQTE